jgi:hypothetical protein
MCRLSRNSGASTSRNPMGLSRPVAGKLFSFYSCHFIPLRNDRHTHTRTHTHTYINIFTTHKTIFHTIKFGGFSHLYSIQAYCPHNFPGLATILTSQICWNLAKKRASLQQRKWNRVTRRTNKMGSGHGVQYERSFYIDSLYLPHTHTHTHTPLGLVLYWRVLM